MNLFSGPYEIYKGIYTKQKSLNVTKKSQMGWIIKLLLSWMKRKASFVWTCTVLKEKEVMKRMD